MAFRVVSPRTVASASGYLSLGEDGWLPVELDGSVEITGTLAATLGALTAASTGYAGPAVATKWDEAGVHWDNPLYFWDDIAVALGTLTQTLASMTLAAAGTVQIVDHLGTLAGTLGAVTLSATGTVVVVDHLGTLTRTLDALTVGATGTVVAAGARTGILEQTLAALTVDADGTVTIVIHAGTLSRTLDPLSSVGTGTAFTPVFPNRRRGFWPQPIGPTHVLVH